MERLVMNGNLFYLPDLGEGLPEAEIREWHVAVGDSVVQDQPLVSVETAKAIVDIPSPRSGSIARLFGESGEMVHTGDPLVEFDVEGARRPDTGTVVGEVKGAGESAEKPAAETRREHPAAARQQQSLGAKATPAVRALAQRLEVDLSIVTPSGPDGLITAADVQRVSRILAEVGPIEPLRGVRRAMAVNLSRAHAEVVGVSIHDDADIQGWASDADVTLRLIRALVAGCAREPALNAWYDAHAVGRRVLKAIHVGIAVDTTDGLFVPILRDVAGRPPEDLRAALDKIKADVRSRSIPPAELRGHTILLSNFGTFAGRYATPVVLPPTVAILGAGKAHDAVVAVDGVPAVHRILPLSLTFDHRAVTGGEAARFLGAVLEDLEKPA
jgi:pyruvate dehydrogenase E2 component (dihydrolipoamide acetyltransferase)